ncbi:PAS domain S-box protein [Candidatus Sumerlaeota bacterium]|nr:PAS domain S-box protein [Candidatus Sumerlaeota bacterium]
MASRPKTDRIRAMIDAIKKVSQGDRSVRIAPGDDDDPFAGLAGEMNRLFEHIEGCTAEFEGEIAARQEAEEALAREQYLMTFLMGVVPDHIYFKDRDSRFLRISKAQATRFGLESPEQAVDKIDFDFFTEEHARQAYNDEQEIIRTGRPLVNFEEKETWPDGRETWASTTKMPLRDRDGNIVGILGISRDVTEHKAAEEALKESQQMLRDVLDTIPVRVFWKDRDLRYLGCNSGFLKDAGLESLDRIVGMDDSQMPWGEYAELYRKDDAEIIETGIPKLFFEEPYLTSDGVRRWVRTSKIPMRDASGEIKGILGCVEDITEQKEMEDTLRMTQVCVDRASIAIYLVGPDAKIVRANNYGCRLLGYTQEEIRGMSTFEIEGRLRPEDWTEHRRDLRDRGSATVESLYRHKDGTIVPVQVTTTFVEFRGEGFAFSFVTDLTESKRAEEEKERLETRLALAQKMECVGRLAGGVAHDFNNMLNVILGYSELLEADLLPGNPLLDDVKEIEKAATRSRDITRQLLAFSRKQIIVPRPVNLNYLIRDTRSTLARLIGEDVLLRFLPEERLGMVNFDNSQLDQILMNLAVNARDAMPDGGTLTIETANVVLDDAFCQNHLDAVPGRYVLLTVSDTGIGMEKETLSHVFEPFFTTKDVGKGTGLGLATVYGIVKQNSGLIDVYSEPRKGTTFRVYLPRIEKEAEAVGEEEENLVASGDEIILLVEDDEMVRRMTAKMLETLGYTVLVAESPDEALRLAEKPEVAIDLLVTDVIMPGMKGTDLRDRIHAVRPGLKVLFMSGYTSNVIVLQGVLEEGVHFVQKPFNLRGLGHEVREAIEG